MLHIYYFAALAETLQCREEQLERGTLSTLGDLRRALAERGDAWQALKHPSTRGAINKHVATDTSPLANNDEVAFFPPVTGG